MACSMASALLSDAAIGQRRPLSFSTSPPWHSVNSRKREATQPSISSQVIWLGVLFHLDVTLVHVPVSSQTLRVPCCWQGWRW